MLGVFDRLWVGFERNYRTGRSNPGGRPVAGVAGATAQNEHAHTREKELLGPGIDGETIDTRQVREQAIGMSADLHERPVGEEHFVLLESCALSRQRTAHRVAGQLAVAYSLDEEPLAHPECMALEPRGHCIH